MKAFLLSILFSMCLHGSSFDFLAVDTRVRCQKEWADPKAGLATPQRDLRLPAFAGRGPSSLMPYQHGPKNKHLGGKCKQKTQ